MGRRSIAFRSLVIIVFMEWRRFVVSSSFILIGVLPPTVVFLYPSMHDFVAGRIQTWNAETIVSTLSPHQIDPELKTNRRPINSNIVQYAVLDQSSWVHTRVRAKILRTDLQLFLEAIHQMDASDFASWTEMVRDELNTRYPDFDSKKFLRDLVEFHGSLTADHIQDQVSELANRIEQTINNQTASVPIDPLVLLWQLVPEQIIGLVPLISFGSFREVDFVVRSGESLHAALLTGELEGYFIVSHADSEAMVDLQLFTRTGSSSSSIKALKLFYQPLVTGVVRTQKLKEARSSDSDHSLVRIHWSEVSASALAKDINWTRHQWWGTPDRVFSFIAKHYSLVVSFVTLVILVVCTPAMTINTVEERSSKLAESLLANVDAKLLLDGKVFGVLIGMFTAIGVWVLFSNMCFLVFPTILPFGGLPEINILHVLHGTLFLFTAIVFYGYMVTAAGSICNNQIDASMILFPVLLLYSLAAICIYDMLEHPSSLITTILGFVPPLTPFIMVGRTGLLPEWPIYVIIVLIMLGSVFLIRSLSGAFFSRALLLEERPRTIRGIIRLARKQD